jgi:hypothetical protein
MGVIFAVRQLSCHRAEWQLWGFKFERPNVAKWPFSEVRERPLLQAVSVFGCMQIASTNILDERVVARVNDKGILIRPSSKAKIRAQL